MSTHTFESRDPISDVWGPRTPYRHEWPTRCDIHTTDTPDHWVQSACILCRHWRQRRQSCWRARPHRRPNKQRETGPQGPTRLVSIAHPDRLRYPLIRRNGKLERASWDEAMTLIVNKAQELRSRLTNHGIGFYTSGQLFMEEYYVLAMIGKAGLNTLHMDGNTRLCTATAASSMRESFGSDGQPGSYTDIDYTDCLFLVGHNMAHTQTVLWSRVLDRLEGPHPPKLIVVDPRKSDTAKRATIHLAPKVGTNVALLNGLQYLLLKNNWIDQEFLSKHVIGLESLRKVVSDYPPEYVEKITAVPVSLLKEAAKLIGTTPSLLSTALQGVYQSNQATAAACQINNINLLRGLIGKAGSGILQMNGQPTAQNNRETGCDGEYPGFRNHLNVKHMQEVADAWNINMSSMPHWALPTHIENMLKYIHDGSIQMFWISGTNPLVSLPNLHKIRELLTKPDLFLVVQDIFLTETAAVADVVLPAAQWGEKTGCFTNVDRTVHLARKAVDPPGEARSDMDIFIDFSSRMGFKNKYGRPLIPYRTPKEVFEAWKKMSTGRPLDSTEMTYEKLTGGSGIQWPCTKEAPYGTERLFSDGRFFTDIEYCESYGHDLETGVPYTRAQYQAMNPAGRAILKSAHYIPSEEQPDERYPIRLSTGRNVYHFHTRTKTGRAKRLQEAYPEPIIQISVEDAVSLQVTDGEMVIVRSRRGSVELPVKIGGISPGDAFIPFHFGYFDSHDGRARAANELTIEQWDPISKQPLFKSGAVRIEKCVQQEGKQIHAPEEQNKAIERVQYSKRCTELVAKDDGKLRVPLLELWLGATHEALYVLIDVYKTIISQFMPDAEAKSGLKVMQQLTSDNLERLKLTIEKYRERHQYGCNTAGHLRDAVFPAAKDMSKPYEELIVFQSLSLFLTFIESHLTALLPSSQALLDADFTEAVKFMQSNIGRQKAWVNHQIKIKSPQTLLVPTVVSEELCRWP